MSTPEELEQFTIQMGAIVRFEIDLDKTYRFEGKGEKEFICVGWQLSAKDPLMIDVTWREVRRIK